MIPTYIKNWLTIIEQMNNDNTYKLAWGRAVVECVYLEDYELGYAISVCARCQNELRAEGEIVTTVLPTCGKDGKLVVAYKFGNDTVATDTIVIPMIDHHITTLDTAEHVIKLVEDGIYKLGYVCEDCGKLVIVARSADEAVIDAIIAELTADYVNELLGRS